MNANQIILNQNKTNQINLEKNFCHKYESDVLQLHHKYSF